AGALLDTSGIPITRTAPGTEPAVAFDGTNWFVVWQGSGSAILGAHVAADGSVDDPDGVPLVAVNGGEPALAFDGTNYLMVWNEDGPAGADYVRAQRVSTAGALLTPLATVYSGSTSQAPPALAFNGASYLA